jgi:hypothetical protein
VLRFQSHSLQLHCSYRPPKAFKTTFPNHNHAACLEHSAAHASREALRALAQSGLADGPKAVSPTRPKWFAAAFFRALGA